ncbi:MAG: SEC-C metal-binding domain-containing protein, partial [Candidatus Omnitrophica bacterium]|nr:SEC-C metal-binding domain-containing protein [Candidatus Omnitrophota bacterium]
GRRWSDGIHQAVEAKEGMRIERENQTLATITFQNYFRMYEKLAGMTGTAFTEAGEFKSIYQLDVVVIPTNRPLIRQNSPDRVYKTEKEKFSAVTDEIARLHEAGAPVLVGTISIDKSERLSEMLKRRGVTHQVLNAKYHEQEAQIVAQAGRFKAVTIATNMAGRGTDILLGGNPEFMARTLVRQKFPVDDPAYPDEYKKTLARCRQEAAEEHKKVVEQGGLHVLGTERHEARRIDNQLRGRSGRQGDPGASRFYVSLSDDLMRLFGSERIIGMMEKLGLEEGQVIEHGWVTKSIEIAQRRVEGHNFEIRKHLLEYDNVMNKQREIIYGQRREVLDGASLKDHIAELSSRIIGEVVAQYIPESINTVEPDVPGLQVALKLKFGLEADEAFFAGLGRQELEEKLAGLVRRIYEEKEAQIGADLLRNLERTVFLQIIDSKWKDHLYAMDNLKEGIGLRAYGQRDPLIEYKREAFTYFNQMILGIEEEALEVLFRLQPVKPQQFKGVFSSLSTEMVHPEAQTFQAEPPGGPLPRVPAAKASAPVAKQQDSPRVGRNDPCPCGSGKKYKKCCGAAS